MNILGFCTHRQEAVTDEICLVCFTDPVHVQIRAAAKRLGGLPRRHLCVAEHVRRHLPLPDPAVLVAIDNAAPAPILAEDLEQLPESSLRHILGNAVMVAEAHPDSPAARTLLQEVRFHVSKRREELARWDAQREAQNAEVERREKRG